MHTPRWQGGSRSRMPGMQGSRRFRREVCTAVAGTQRRFLRSEDSQGKCRRAGESGRSRGCTDTGSCLRCLNTCFEPVPHIQAGQQTADADSVLASHHWLIQDDESMWKGETQMWWMELRTHSAVVLLQCALVDVATSFVSVCLDRRVDQPPSYSAANDHYRQIVPHLAAHISPRSHVPNTQLPSVVEPPAFGCPVSEQSATVPVAQRQSHRRTACPQIDGWNTVREQSTVPTWPSNPSVFASVLQH
eukprot:3936623-Rhodomonas_salina.1